MTKTANMVVVHHKVNNTWLAFGNEFTFGLNSSVKFCGYEHDNIQFANFFPTETTTLQDALRGVSDIDPVIDNFELVPVKITYETP